MARGAKANKGNIPEIRALERKLSLEMLAAALFLLVSIGAGKGFPFLPALTPKIRTVLGAPPSPNMINTLLLLYIFSAIILILGRMMAASGKASPFGHLGYLTGFYFFHHFSGSLPEYFWAVFITGITIYFLECYHIFLYCTEESKKIREKE